MQKGEIWIADLSSGVGHEQEGTRPVIIMSSLDSLELSVILPLTTNPHANEYPYTYNLTPSKSNGLDSVSVALVFQVRTISQKRLKKQIGTIKNKDMRIIDRLIIDLLRLKV